MASVVMTHGSGTLACVAKHLLQPRRLLEELERVTPLVKRESQTQARRQLPKSLAVATEAMGAMEARPP